MRLCEFVLVVVIIHSVSFLSAAEETKQTSDSGIRIVFFTPSDVDPPENVKERMKQIVDYSEAFFKKWMNHWDYECENPLRIRRDKEGFPEILFIKGEHKSDSGKYDKLGYANTEVIPKAMKKFKISSKNQVWWVFSYPGPTRRAYRGGGNHLQGTSSANFKVVEGNFKPEDELASGAAETFLLKAVIHELSHALGLPHIGPLEQDKCGNSLMGPVNKAYKKKYNNDSRVYLSKASAALLWKHPLFSGGKDLDVNPKVELQNFKATYNAEKNIIEVSGKLKANYPAHSVVIGNASKSDRTDYWKKHFTGRIKPDGSFSCEIQELKKSDGNLDIVFCFNNGAVKGQGTGFGTRNSIRKPYKYQDGKYIFK